MGLPISSAICLIWSAVKLPESVGITGAESSSGASVEDMAGVLEAAMDVSIGFLDNIFR